MKKSATAFLKKNEINKGIFSLLANIALLGTSQGHVLPDCKNRLIRDLNLYLLKQYLPIMKKSLA